jgi:hypothetical protein
MKHRAPIPIESRLQGGVNRANLKFTNLITTTSRVSVRNKNESKRGRKTNRERIKECDTRICFTEVRFSQTYSQLRRSQRPGLFQPFPSPKRSPRPSELLFSINRNTKFPQGPPHNWCLMPCLQMSLIARRMRKKEAIQAQELKRIQQISLTYH